MAAIARVEAEIWDDEHLINVIVRVVDTDGAEGIPFVRFGRCKRIPKAALLALGSDFHAVA